MRLLLLPDGPDLDLAVGASGRDQAPVRAEGQAEDRFVVPRECVNLLPRAGVPNLNGLVPAPGRKVFPVRTVRHAPDARPMLVEGKDLPARGCLPDLHLTRLID